MSQTALTSGTVVQPQTLPAFQFRALSIQALLLMAAAMVLPAIAHLTGLPVRILVPMHWPVILVGLCYGWRSGAIIGFAAPSVSFLLSGMPYPVILPAMTVELAVYGFGAGFFREVLHRNYMLSTALALVCGRIVFLLSAVLTGGFSGPFLDYLQVALIPGLPAFLCQILAMPAVAACWVKRERQRSEGNQSENLSI